MSLTLHGMIRALTANVAETAPEAADPRLRGRTYAIPFDAVWRAASDLAAGQRGWTITASDDYEGTIQAEARTLVMRFVDEVTIRIRLDDNAQTRVDMRSASRKGVGDFGTNARRIGRFMRLLDKRLLEGAGTA